MVDRLTQEPFLRPQSWRRADCQRRRPWARWLVPTTPGGRSWLRIPRHPGHRSAL